MKLSDFDLEIPLGELDKKFLQRRVHDLAIEFGRSTDKDAQKLAETFIDEVSKRHKDDPIDAYYYVANLATKLAHKKGLGEPEKTTFPADFSI